MTPYPQNKKSKLSRTLCQLLLLSLTQVALPWTTFAQGPRPREGVVLKSSQPFVQQDKPCPPEDQSETCRLKRAVVALQDQIEDFEKKIAAAKLAVEQQQTAIESANKAFAAFEIERKSYQTVIEIHGTALKQAQEIMAAYQDAVKTLQALVAMVMGRVKDLEKERDSANKRAAILSVVLIIAGTLSQIKR